MPGTPISGEGVFSLPFVGSVAYVASPIPRLVCLKVVEALRPAPRQRPNVTVMRIKAVVDKACLFASCDFFIGRLQFPDYVVDTVCFT